MLQLAHHVQSCLHAHNVPRLSFYEQMMTNKLQEQQRIEAAERERLKKEMEACKEEEEEEVGWGRGGGGGWVEGSWGEALLTC